MHWRDQGFLLSSRPHGETSAIIEIFTQDHGRHVGLLRGGSSRKVAAALQPGSQLTLEWRARLVENLGVFTIEPVKVRSAQLFKDRLALSALTSICALLTRILPERQPSTRFYHQTIEFLDELGMVDDWMVGYLQWELRLLQEAGHGLNLNHCILTGSKKGLRYVSPKSGGAVTSEAAGEWASRLLDIPACLVGGSYEGLVDFHTGLQLTGHFIKLVISELGNPEKAFAARKRLEDTTLQLVILEQRM